MKQEVNYSLYGLISLTTKFGKVVVYNFLNFPLQYFSLSLKKLYFGFFYNRNARTLTLKAKRKRRVYILLLV